MEGNHPAESRKVSEGDIDWGSEKRTSEMSKKDIGENREDEKKEFEENKVNIMIDNKKEAEVEKGGPEEGFKSRNLKQSESEKNQEGKDGTDDKDEEKEPDSDHDSLPQRPKVRVEDEGEREVVPSTSENLKPILRRKEEQMILNKEPQISQIKEESHREEPQPAQDSLAKEPAEAPQDAQKFSGQKRPKTRGESTSHKKNFIIKKKQRRLQSGFRKNKKWNERFYLADGTFQPNDGVNNLFTNTRSFRHFKKQKRSQYFTKLSTIEKNAGAVSHRKLHNFTNLKHKRHNSMEKITRERRWNERFYITNSKNNQKVFNDYKEFFDKPIDYDVRGYNFTIRPAPMMVYEDESGKADIIRPRFDDVKKKQLKKRISKERATTSRGKKRDFSKTTQFNKHPKPADYGLSNNVVFSGFLRTQKIDHKKTMQKINKKEKKWDERFAVPVSTYNEAVYKKFRVPFEEL
ncbi:unnamed protein product [Moneuplotes crassus]|uniref:Uncharacterized protein n=1 Tax=Euplotes crassus TaxID=5936 RepID=A0AAD1UFJ2_EUPCR|nr:unnamed protein product [Moneuplotes crassus]